MGKDSEKSSEESELTPEQIKEILKRSAIGAEKLNRDLRRIFRLPDRILYFD
jgi:hypothetical protein